MSITYPLQAPLSGSNIEGFRVIAHAQVGRTFSPFTGEDQVYAYQGQWWELDVQGGVMTRAEAEPWVTFMLQLNGKQGTFLAGDPLGRTPRGVVTGTPRVAVDSLSGNDLRLYSLTASLANVFRAGDYLQVGSSDTCRLHKVLKDVGTNVSGVASLDIWPRLRESPTSGSIVYYTNAQGVFRLSSNEMIYTLRTPNLYEVSFTATEKI